METKKVYPTRRNAERLVCGILIAATCVTVFSGIVFKGNTTGFLVETVPGPSVVPLNEAFDETITEIVVELPEYTWYGLQTGAFEAEERALESAQAFQKRGAAGYLWKDGRFRVMAAVYPLKEDAQLVRQQLREQHEIDTYLYQIRYPSVKLRLRGMQGQLEILQSAFSYVHELTAQLQKLSVEIDRQEANVEEIEERLRALKTQTDIIEVRIRQRFASPVPETVKKLLDCFEHFAAFCSSSAENKTSAVLGAKLKYQTLDTLWDIQNVYDTLNVT